jgi:glutaredoxin
LARAKPLALYTRPGCHLCDVAKDTLMHHRRHLPELEEVNIESDPALKERFGTEIPVVEIDGRVRFRGRVDEVLLRRLIDATPPRPR